MAKKVRRVKKKKQSDTASAPEVDSAGAVTAVKETPAESFRQEYSYVVKDLRRILLLSAAMFLLLVVLNLVLQI